MSQLIGDLFTSDKIDLDYMADEGNQFTRFQNWKIQKNIATGTTDPGYRVYNLNYLFSYIEFVFI